MDLWRKFPDVEFGECVEQLRALIYQHVQDNPSEFDLVDVQSRITPPELVSKGTKLASKEANSDNQICDWMLKRLLLLARPQLDLQSALKKFIEIFNFRKKHQVAELTLGNTLPEEFYRLGIFLVDDTAVDHKGNRLLILRIKYYRKHLEQLDVLIKRATLYLVEQHDLAFEQGQFSGITIVVDTQGFNYRNVNLDLMKFMVNIGFIYAGPLKRVLVYDLPWTFTFLLRMVQSWVALWFGSKLDMFHLVNSHNIHQFVDSHMLPDFLTGTKCATNEVIPAEAIPFLEMIALLDGLIEEKNVQKMYDYMLTIL